MQYALADVSSRGIDEIRPLAPALGALLPLLPLPVAELNGVYCLRVHISPPSARRRPYAMPRSATDQQSGLGVRPEAAASDIDRLRVRGNVRGRCAQTTWTDEEQHPDVRRSALALCANSASDVATTRKARGSGTLTSDDSRGLHRAARPVLALADSLPLGDGDRSTAG